MVSPMTRIALLVAALLALAAPTAAQISAVPDGGGGFTLFAPGASPGSAIPDGGGGFAINPPRSYAAPRQHFEHEPRRPSLLESMPCRTCNGSGGAWEAPVQAAPVVLHCRSIVIPDAPTKRLEIQGSSAMLFHGAPVVPPTVLVVEATGASSIRFHAAAQPRARYLLDLSRGAFYGGGVDEDMRCWR